MAIDFPSSPSVGATWPNPPVANQPVYTWDGEKWTSGTGYGNIYIADAAPAAPVGSLWWNSLTGRLYVRFNDGNSTQWVEVLSGNTDPVVPGHLFGLTLSTTNLSAIMTVAAGSACDSTGQRMMRLTSPMSKVMSAWAAGSGNGALDTGVAAINTWYSWFIIMNPTTGAVDVLFSLSPTAPVLPSGYTLFRRIGTVPSTTGPTWNPVRQLGDEFLLDTPLQAAAGVTLGTTATTQQVTVPPGIQVNALIYFYVNPGAAVSYILISSLDTADILPSVTAFDIVVTTTLQAQVYLSIRTSTAQLIRTRASATSGTAYIECIGWIDTRGRFG